MIMRTCTAYVLLVILLDGRKSVQEPDMELLPQGVPQEVPLYQGQPVHIDCIATGTDTLSWGSNEYVGADPVMVRATSVDIITEMGAVIRIHPASEGMLMSRLEFYVTTGVSNSSVTCRNINQSREDSIYIPTRDVNATVLRIVSEQEKFCDGDKVELECTAKNSSFIQWEFDGQTVSRCRSSEVNGGVPQTTCRHNVTLNTGLHQVMCRNIDVGVTNTTEIQVADCSQPMSDDVTTTVSVSEDDQNSDSQLSAAASIYPQTVGFAVGTLSAALLTTML